jgi:hypothetical protein
MQYICTDIINESLNIRSDNMFERQNIQKRIRFLQRSLVQLSFTTNINRSQIYTNLIESLDRAQRLLIESKKLESKMYNVK